KAYARGTGVEHLASEDDQHRLIGREDAEQCRNTDQGADERLHADIFEAVGDGLDGLLADPAQVWIGAPHEDDAGEQDEVEAGLSIARAGDTEGVDRKAAK